MKISVDRRPLRKTAIIVAVLALVFFSATDSLALSFRDEFTLYYKGHQFARQTDLIKRNRKIVPREIKLLINDALAKEDFYEKMYLLDIAAAMGSTYAYLFGDNAPLHEVETIIRMEAKKEKARLARINRWKPYEKLLGNFIMKEHLHQMEREGLTPVIYPHWVHRIFFKCKVCHDEIFIPTRGANDLSMAHFEEGRQCGTCHREGGVAFGTKDKKTCIRCHSAATFEAEHLKDMKNIDNSEIKETAGRLGARWDYEKLPGGRVPLDRFGFIDWLKLTKLGVISPVASLEKGYREETRDTKIYFESASELVKNVVFDHSIHSDWIRCTTCHPSIFKAELGGNNIKMTDMASGRFCGHCHGRVSFTFADCTRCHRYKKGDVPPGALIHRAKKAAGAEGAQ